MYFPLQSRSACNVNVAHRVIAVLVSLYVVYEAQAFFTFHYDTPRGRLACFAFSNSYLRIYTRVDSFLYSYIPLTVIFICNTAIILKLVMSRYTEQKATSISLTKAAKSITVMLVAACVMFIVCSMPYALLFDLYMDVDTYKYSFMTILLHTNHSINFVVYTLTNNQFRKELMKLFSCKDNQIHSQAPSVVPASN